MTRNIVKVDSGSWSFPSSMSMCWSMNYSRCMTFYDYQSWSWNLNWFESSFSWEGKV